MAVDCVPRLLELARANVKRAGCGENVKFLPAFMENSSEISSEGFRFNEGIFETKFKAIHISFEMEKEHVERVFLTTFCQVDES